MFKFLIVALSGAVLAGGVAVATGVGADRAGQGTTVPTQSPTQTTPKGEDVSGPCDEAEHANDPRCATGQPQTEPREDGHQGRGRDDGREDDANGDDGDHHGDRSGPSGNSGPGSQNSGPGNSSDRGEPNDDRGAPADDRSGRGDSGRDDSGGGHGGGGHD